MKNNNSPSVSNRGQHPIRTFARLLKYLLEKNHIRIVWVILLIMMSAYANVAGSLFLKNVIDQYITPLLKQTHPNFDGFLRAIIGMSLVYLGGIVAGFTYNILMVKISEGTQQKIRNQMFKNLENLPIVYFDTHSHGDIMSHFTNDTDTLRQMISQSIPNLVLSAITFVTTFVAMFSVSWILTLFVIFTLIIMFFMTQRLTQRSSRYFAKQQHDLGQVNGYIEEMLHGQKVIKIFNHEDQAIKNFDQINDQLQETATQANVLANTLMPLMFNSLNIQYVLLAIIGGMLSLSGFSNFTVGNIAAFLQLSRTLGQPVSQIAQQTNFIVMALSGAERIFNLMDQKLESDQGNITLVKQTFNRQGWSTESWAWKCPQSDGNVTYKPLKGKVAFKDVNFSYRSDQQVLYDINLTAQPGQKIALVGATGAGKTTITNLLTRFYEIQDGVITYDGIDLRRIQKASLRRSLGMVLQDTNLFTGTVADNIRFGNLDASASEIYAAAKLANADQFIEQLPQKYDSVLNNNAEELSQGQRQLIAIARAAVANPPVMILDEATSSIDTRTEALVQSGMDQLMQGRTVFVIAHRLSTIQNSDVILVMDHGQIIERGNHQELLQKRGLYYQLYTGKVALE